MLPKHSPPITFDPLKMLWNMQSLSLDFKMMQTWKWRWSRYCMSCIGVWNICIPTEIASLEKHVQRTLCFTRNGQRSIHPLSRCHCRSYKRFSISGDRRSTCCTHRQVSCPKPLEGGGLPIRPWTLDCQLRHRLLAMPSWYRSHEALPKFSLTKGDQRWAIDSKITFTNFGGSTVFGASTFH